MILRRQYLRRKGSSILLYVFGLVIVSAFLIYSLRLGVSLVHRFDMQRHADEYALLKARSITRALNAIAAGNQGLEQLSIQATGVAAYALGLSICAAASFWGGACVEKWARMSIQLPGYFADVQKTGKELANQQNQFLEFIHQQLQQNKPLDLWNQFSSHQIFVNCSGASQLSIERKAWSKDSEASSFAGGSDQLKCENRSLSSWSELATLQKSNNFHPMDELVALYEQGSNSQTVTVRNKAQLNELSETFVLSENQYLRFRSAQWKHCESFHNLLSSLSSGAMKVFRIPSKLVLQPTYFQDKQFEYLAVVTEQKNQPGNNPTFLGRQEDKMWFWGAASVRIKGANLNEMNFSTELIPTELDQRQWSQIKSIINQLALTTIQLSPSKEQFDAR